MLLRSAIYDVAPDRQAMQEGGGEADEGRQSE